MFGRKKLIGVKPAEISIEISLSLVMSVVVLFLVLGLFGNSIQNIAEASGLRNLFSRNNEAAKTLQDQRYAAKNPAQTQVNVQLVADQGLSYYISNAQATIAKYKETPPTTQKETEDLARAVAIAKITKVLTSSDESLFDKTCNIYVEETSSKKTYLYANNEKLAYSTYNSTYSDSQTIDLIKTIMSCPFGT